VLQCISKFVYIQDRTLKTETKSKAKIAAARPRPRPVYIGLRSVCLKAGTHHPCSQAVNTGTCPHPCLRLVNTACERVVCTGFKTDVMIRFLAKLWRFSVWIAGIIPTFNCNNTKISVLDKCFISWEAVIFTQQHKCGGGVRGIVPTVLAYRAETPLQVYSNTKHPSSTCRKRSQYCSISYSQTPLSVYCEN